ncbi:MAG: His/Gly/Thr/Pro-type tRNA ligase C-terminal domain-containing protein [Acidimicrobiia bacterium]
MSKRMALILALAVVASACANSDLGRSIPACPTDTGAINSVGGSMILQMQAVETAEYVPCLNDLKVGWSYEHLIAKRSNSRFWLDSDRLGSHFLEVVLTPECDLGAATQVSASQPDVEEFRDIELVGSTATIVIVPVTGRETGYALEIEAELEARQINDRQIFVVFDEREIPLADKVEEAGRRDRPIIIVDEQDALAGTATLQMPGENQSVRGLDLDELLDRIEDQLPEPSFTGVWFTVFEGGCITYEFDASGPGVDRLAGDIEEALGLFPAGDVWRVMREVGVVG